MAVVRDAVSNGGANAASHTFSHTVGSGSDRALYVATNTDYSGSRTVTGVTYGGTALDLYDTHNDAYQSTITVYRMLNPPTGTADIVVTVSAASAACSGAISLTGVNQADPDDAAVKDFSGDAFPSMVVSSETGDLVLQFIGTQDSNVPGTPGTDETEIVDRTQNYLGIVGYEQNGAASVTMAPTLQQTYYTWTAIAFNVNQATGGATAATKQAFYRMLRAA